jgi:hypothetical protein
MSNSGETVATTIRTKEPGLSFWIGVGIGYAAGLISFWAIVLIMEKVGL